MALTVRTLISSRCQSLFGSLAQHQWHHLAGNLVQLFLSTRWAFHCPAKFSLQDERPDSVSGGTAQGLFTTIQAKQDEELTNIWMCSEAAKALNFIRHTDYSPSPVAFLVSTHSNKLHRAGSGTQLSKVLGTVSAVVSEYWPRDSLMWGFSSKSGDNFGCGHPFVEAQGHCHRQKEPLSQWVFIYYGQSHHKPCQLLVQCHDKRQCNSQEEVISEWTWKQVPD